MNSLSQYVGIDIIYNIVVRNECPNIEHFIFIAVLFPDTWQNGVYAIKNYKN